MVPTRYCRQANWLDAAMLHPELNNNLDSLDVKLSHTYRGHAKVLWRYMTKPHVQLVLVSFIHY